MVHAAERVSPEETHLTEALVVEHAQIAAGQAVEVVYLAQADNRLFGGTAIVLVDRSTSRTSWPCAWRIGGTCPGRATGITWSRVRRLRIWQPVSASRRTGDGGSRVRSLAGARVDPRSPQQVNCR